MEEKVGNFNQKHFVGHVLLGKIAKRLPSKLSEIDLRFFSMIRLGDTYNGADNPLDGVAYQAVMYGNQIAWERYDVYHMCSRETTHKRGSELYRRLYYVSRLYLKIQKFGRDLYFRKETEEGADTFFIGQEDLELLKEHPQFKEMVEVLGLELSLVEDKTSHFRMTISKFHEPE